MARAALLERLRPGPRLVWRTATVREVVPESARARTLVLDVPGWSGHRAGQHVDIRLTAEDGYQAERSYSIASAPELDAVELTVELVEDGEVSPYLVEEVRPGDVFEVRGPVGGHFTWSAEEGGPLFLVAGGSGLVPLMAMLRHRAARASEAAAHVLVSARSPDDALYRAELDGLGPRAGLHVAWTFTRAAPDGWTGFARRVDAAMLEEAGPPRGAHPRCFVCGPTPFVEEVAGLLVAAGHDPAAIHTERFGPTGTRS
ncbi:MAG: ferredoxin reductase [Solirubrobacterales bacterium]|nr:ferredoxin reductase [Solirubrobacterales bacterium]